MGTRPFIEMLINVEALLFTKFLRNERENGTLEAFCIRWIELKLLDAVTKNETSIYPSEKKRPTCKRHLHYYCSSHRTGGNLTESVRLHGQLLPYLRRAPNHHCLLGRHRPHVMDCLQ